MTIGVKVACPAHDRIRLPCCRLRLFQRGLAARIDRHDGAIPYLTRKQAGLELAIEHRSAPTPDPVLLELDEEALDGPHLRTCEREPEDTECPPQSLTERVLSYLGHQHQGVKVSTIRAELRVRMQRLVDTLRELERDGRVSRSDCGWQAAAVDLRQGSGETEAGSAEEQPAEG